MTIKFWVRKKVFFFLKLELANIFCNGPNNKGIRLFSPYQGCCDFLSQFLYPQISHRCQYINEWYDCIPAQLNLRKLVAILICSESISFSTLPSIPYVKDNCWTVGNIWIKSMYTSICISDNCIMLI